MNFKKSLMIALLSMGVVNTAFAETTQEKLYRAAEYYKQENYTQAFPLFKELAEKGLTPAQLAVGNMYDEGQGVAQDYTQAFYWFKQAADQGNILGQRMVGGYYMTGQGVEFDRKKAKKYFKLACDQNDKMSCSLLKTL